MNRAASTRGGPREGRSPRRVVVTGVGLVTPCGGTLAAVGEAACAGRSAAATIASFDAGAFPTRFAAQVPPPDRAAAAADPDGGELAAAGDWKGAFGVLAARRAIAHSRWIAGSALPPERVGLFLGTGLSSLSIAELEEEVLPYLAASAGIDLRRMGAEAGSHPGSPLPWRHLTDRVNRIVARLAGAAGGSASHFGACAASTQAIGEAFRRVRDGSLDAALAGGMDSMVHPFGMISFMLLGALSTKNERPAEGCRPFHRGRDGFLLGEGAAVFVIEERGAALARGATIHGELRGYGASLDGYHVTAPRPDGAGARAAMERALEDAGVRPEEIGYVNAHGTGTELNDPAEAAAVRAVFGRKAAALPISSVKPVVGHLVAAAGAIETAVCLAAFALDRLPPTANLDAASVDPDCGGLGHLFEARPGCPEIVMTNNYGFGGQNASLVLAKGAAR